jgi:hypothetical protein
MYSEESLEGNLTAHIQMFRFRKSTDWASKIFNEELSGWSI